jgi:WD40 repeat protein
LRKDRFVTEGAARWVIDSWWQAIRSLLREEARAGNEESDSPLLLDSVPAFSVARPAQFGVVAQSQKAVRTVTCSPFGDDVAFAGDERLIYLWNFHSRETRVLGAVEGPVSSVAYSPNGVLIASANESAEQGKSSVRVWDLRTSEMLDLGEGGAQSPSVAFSPGGKSLACASAEPTGVLRVWNLQTGMMRVLKGAAGESSSISFSPDGKCIAAADSFRINPEIRVCDLETGTARSIGSSRRQITSLAFSADGKSVASGSGTRRFACGTFKPGKPECWERTVSVFAACVFSRW